MEASLQLKQSLSNTLTLFYPLAGRIQDGPVVDCNDAGAEFIEASIQAQLNDALQEPIIEQLKHFAVDAAAGRLPGAALVAAKVTFFNCGGIAIGVSVSHKLADGASIMTFLNVWTASCRGEAEFPKFSVDLAHYFPPRKFPDSPSVPKLMLNEKNIVTKRFVFDKENLEALKHAATSPSGSNVKNPTRVEVVSAFIWKHFIDVAKSENPEAKKIFAASHAVNLRGRRSPPLDLENVFGNCFMSTTALTSNGEFHDLVTQLRSTIKKVNEDYITKAKTGDSYLNDKYKLVSLIMNWELELCGFSSWCGFPLYEVDYGWGKPISLGASAPIKNTTVLVNSRSGDGVEAFITMPQDNVEILESQIKLLSCNPNQINS
ncbi:UNVERIFIED_CONTAM: Stemmadenine O-acetyltransferase [Sesamum radiatum]|uniref:Stemmadenine O-acetyltransferase n=1 Tax=Sesamum radiatum TaxID=300843 RepID=A0AAW2U9B9_SESRA